MLLEFFKLNDVNTLGQVFTPEHIVERMLFLRFNRGSILEPSCGDGAFLSHLENEAVGIEIDEFLIKDDRVTFCDFFSYDTENKFDTIIGNPPYVRFQDIQQNTKSLLPMKLFDKRSNLYLFFIFKALLHLKERGELIFITPRDFLKATSASRLNEYLYKNGTITHYYELGDASVFFGYTPNCSIWRWEKGNYDRHMRTGGVFCYRNGQLWFGENDSNSCVGDFFHVKVGAVSGADRIFSHSQFGCTEFVCSMTAKSGGTRRMIYNRKDPYLFAFKRMLMNRRIRKFDESNWWEWGRRYYESDQARVYVNCKTRNSSPFFIHENNAYDGSVMALFPKRNDLCLRDAQERLNKNDWRRLGFVCDGRYLFTQKSLENAPFDFS